MYAVEQGRTRILRDRGGGCNFVRELTTTGGAAFPSWEGIAVRDLGALQIVIDHGSNEVAGLGLALCNMTLLVLHVNSLHVVLAICDLKTLVACPIST